MIVKRTWPALVALLVTLAFAGTANGYVLGFSPMPGENIEFISEGALALEGGGGALSVRCHVTLSGTLTEETFAKTEGLQVGSINRSSVESCTGGSLSFLRLSEAPSRITYRGFLGTLPNMTGLRYRIEGLAIQATGLATCLYTGNIDALMPLSGLETWTIGTNTIQSGTLTLSSGTLCPETASLSGRMTLPNMQVILEPFMRFTPGSLGFGSRRLEEPAVTLRTRFENASPEQIEITEVSTAGGGCSSFTFENGMGQLAAGRNLIANGRIEISATFRPRSTGRLFCDYFVTARLRGTEKRRALVVWGRGI